MVAGCEGDTTNTDSLLRNNRIDAFRMTTHPIQRRGDTESLRTTQIRAMSQPSLYSNDKDDTSQLPLEAILTDEGTRLKFYGDYNKGIVILEDYGHFYLPPFVFFDYSIKNA